MLDFVLRLTVTVCFPKEKIRGIYLRLNPGAVLTFMSVSLLSDTSKYWIYTDAESISFETSDCRVESILLQVNYLLDVQLNHLNRHWLYSRLLVEFNLH